MSKRLSPVRTLTVSPDEPAVPAKRTSPPAAATTGAPTSPAMSMPRCWPEAYGSSPLRYGVITSPLSGQTQSAHAGGTSNRRASTAVAAEVRMRRRMPSDGTAGPPRQCEPRGWL